MSYFNKINQDKARRVTNILVESPFFYRSDDENLFLYLRRNQSHFRKFFRECFDWELVVESRCARVIKQHWHNPALKPSQRDVFNLSTRDDCIGFLLILEYYEHLLDEQNLSIDDLEPPRFYFGSLFTFASERMAEELAEQAPDEAGVKKILRRVMEQLIRFRFLRELPREADDVVDRENLIYECLPGLYSYDIRRLGPKALAGFLGSTIPNPMEASS